MMEPEFIINEDTGKKIVEWNESGKIEKPTEEQDTVFHAQITEFGITEDEWYEKMKSRTKGKPWSSLSEEEAKEILDAQETKLILKREENKKNELKEPESEGAKQAKKAYEDVKKQQTEEEELTKDFGGTAVESTPTPPADPGTTLQ